MAHFAPEEYALMLEETTGLLCDVSAENLEDLSKERIRFSYNGADILYVRPPKTREELEMLIPAYFDFDERHLNERIRIAVLLQSDTALTARVAEALPCLDEKMKQQHEEAFVYDNDQGVEEEGISITERIRRLRAQIGAAVFNMPELLFIQLQREAKKGRV